jgi:hypothetical protein
MAMFLVPDAALLCLRRPGFESQAIVCDDAVVVVAVFQLHHPRIPGSVCVPG